MSVHCSLMVTCWERAILFALLYVMLSCVFVTFPSRVLVQVWYLIVSIPDICLCSSIKSLPDSMQRVDDSSGHDDERKQSK